MKKIIVAIVAVLVIAIAALVILPGLVPAERIRQEVVAQVKNATGRDLAIDGKVSVSVFPSLSVQVSNVGLSNPPGYQGKEMVRLGALDVRLKLLPILSGKIEVDSFVLIDPLITLEMDRQGRPNWAFDGGSKAPAATPSPAPGQTPAQGGSGSGLADLSLGTVRIDNGKLTFVDARNGSREEVSDINLSIGLANLDAPLSVKGDLAYRGKKVDLALTVARARVLLEGGNAPAELTLATDALKLAFKGDAVGLGVNGDLDLSIPSVRGLVQWATAKPLDLPGSGLGPFAVKAKLAASPSRVALNQAAIALDAIKANGDLAVELAGPRPALKGKLAVEALDVTPYLPPEDANSKAVSGTPANSKPAAKSSDWSDAAIDLSALKSADADLALAAGSITIRALKIGRSELRLVLSNGKLTADLARLELYQGTGQGRLSLDGSQAGTAGLDASFSLKGLAAAPFLTDAAGFDRLEGTGNADIQVSGRGKSERALISSLNGKGGLTFLNGAIRGINLAEMVRNVTTAFTATSGSQKTDFAELGGTFTITNGIVTNKDLSLKSPLLRVEGAGSVELPPRTLHYRIDPKAVASLQGQGGSSDLTGVTVPVIIEGPWDSLTYRPDLEALAKNKIGEAIGGKLPGNLLGGSKNSDGASSSKSSPLPINPGSLFGR